MGKDELTTMPDNWQGLSRFTSARIALGRAGMSLPTQGYLEFQLAHALARDAVNIPLDFTTLEQDIHALGYPALMLQSRVENHAMYLQRPDLGRLLNKSSLGLLAQDKFVQYDAVAVVVDGLSSAAIEHHGTSFLSLLLPELETMGYKLPPICLVRHGRVAIGDAIAEYYSARLCIVLIGERPGLSSPDSMGIYFTYQAKSGVSTDADRNCISNIHDNGLNYNKALTKLLFLINQSEHFKFSGIKLKDETIEGSALKQQEQANFLLY